MVIVIRMYLILSLLDAEIAQNNDLSNKEECWYFLNSKNVLVKTPEEDKYEIVKRLQKYIDEERDLVW